MSNYWRIIAEEAMERQGITLTDEQLDEIAEDIEIAADSRSQACGYDAIPDPRDEEIRALKASLRSERNKTVCRECSGHGRLVSYDPCGRSIDEECYKCHGEGRT